MRRIYELDITVESIRRTSSDTDSRDEHLRRKVDSLRLVRDRFIIGAFTGLRVSDYGRLSEANIGADTIRIKTTKTGAVVVVPIHPWVRNILQSGFDASIHISDQKMNKHLKEIAKMAGIDEEITLNKNVGGKNEQRTFRKYELVCTHTARRSFATNAYKAGVPTIAIMKITGHTKESTFLRYIKVSAEENAEMLRKHNFWPMQILSYQRYLQQPFLDAPICCENWDALMFLYFKNLIILDLTSVSILRRILHSIFFAFYF